MADGRPGLLHSRLLFGFLRSVGAVPTPWINHGLRLLAGLAVAVNSSGARLNTARRFISLSVCGALLVASLSRASSYRRRLTSVFLLLGSEAVSNPAVGHEPVCRRSY